MNSGFYVVLGLAAVAMNSVAVQPTIASCDCKIIERIIQYRRKADNCPIKCVPPGRYNITYNTKGLWEQEGNCCGYSDFAEDLLVEDLTIFPCETNTQINIKFYQVAPADCTDQYDWYRSYKDEAGNLNKVFELYYKHGVYCYYKCPVEPVDDPSALPLGVVLVTEDCSASPEEQAKAIEEAVDILKSIDIEAVKRYPCPASTCH